ncbi:Crp/Fnr family transcriptional regulator [Mycoplana rhizolycopersici]|jgi:CRP/FNR family transcriptional regulator|uniref:Crp/Fnr family transcriptional regulator n=1 Tax=Mycoplana rhizolycopersici TaxID=2746702 RepID=A0ABX2QHF7_9HYPH|nr:Crp/Fnr family transcriptional regulator [Rhizobium rhizolycopersici]NVP57120.1 Crp/Fnr family transcriptional regulator [Rhizobium rhizolycopersici]
MDMQRKDIHSSEIPVVCRACEARHGGVCGALSPEQLVDLSKHSTRKRLEAGTEVVGQGEDMGAFANIMRGVVKLTRMMPDGRQQIVGLQFAPDFLGRPFVEESPHSAETATDTEICTFPRQMLERLVSRTPDLEHKLYQQSLKELDEARDWMLTLGRKNAQEKVASFLFLIATHYDPETVEGSVFDLPLSRADIADFLGLTIETVSRQFTRLRKDGVIQIENNRHVIVPDIDRLQQFAGID